MESGPQPESSGEKEKELEIVQQLRRECWADQGLGQVGFQGSIILPKQVVSKGSQEQEELKDELRSRPMEL